MKTVSWKQTLHIPIDFEMTVPRGIVMWLSFIMAAGIYIYSQILFEVLREHTIKNYYFLFVWYALAPVCHHSPPPLQPSFVYVLTALRFVA